MNDNQSAAGDQDRQVLSKAATPTPADLAAAIPTLPTHVGEGSTTAEVVPQSNTNGLPWGMHDMHGNVCEWCLDFVEAAPGGSVTNLLGSLTDSRHVVKGGHFTSTAPGCRSAWRHYTIPAANVTGFRVVLAPPMQLADQTPKHL